MANTIDVLGDEQAATLLISRTITEFIDNVITTIGLYAFYQCNALTNIDFPAVISIDGHAFDECTALSSINFPLATTLGEYAFYGCSQLTNANFPAATSVSARLFQGCSRLTSVNFPVATTIGINAFRGCSSNLKRVDFPAVTTIASNAFNGCTSLATVILRNTDRVVNLLNSNAFSGANNAIIYVPDSLVDSYKSATNWSTYASRIKGLSELPSEA